MTEPHEQSDELREHLRENHVPKLDEPSGDDTIDEVRADIAATRAQLADTVDALTSKLDVKEQGRQKIAAAKDSVQHAASDTAAHVSDAATKTVQTAEPYKVPIAAGAAAVVAVLAVVLIRRRRR